VDHLGWNSISHSAQEFVVACLAKNPAERLTAKKCLLHEWLMAEVDSSTPLVDAKRGIQKMQMRRKFKVGVDAAREKQRKGMFT